MKVTVYKHTNTESGAIIAYVLPGMENKPIAEVYETKKGVYLVLLLNVGWYDYRRKVCNTKRTAVRNAEDWVMSETRSINMEYISAELEIVPND